MDAIETTKTVLDMAYKLYMFIENTKVVSQTVNELHAETNQLGIICSVVETEIKKFHDQAGDSDGQIFDLIRQQLAECEKSMHRLEENLSSIRKEGRNFVIQGYRQMVLQMKEEDIAESRAQIRAHSGNLQISLLLITLNASYLGPKQVNEMMGEKINRLERLIEKHGSKEDTPLMQIARKCLSEGSTLYEASVCRGIVAPRPNRAQARTIAWIEDMETLRLNQVNNVETSTGPRSVRHPYQRVKKEKHRGRPRYLPAFLYAKKKVWRIGKSGPADSEPSVEGASVELDSATLASSNVDDEANGHDSDIDDADIEFEVAKITIKSADKAFEEGDYIEAHDMLQDALDQIKSLPAHKMSHFNLGEMQFQLATCTFYLKDSDESETALLSVLDQTTISGTDARNLCTAGHLLAQAYVRNGKLGMAESACKDAYNNRQKLFGQGHVSCYESLGLLSRIYALSNNHSRAKSCMTIVPIDEQDRVQKLFEGLQHISSDITGLTEVSMNNSNASTLEVTPTTETATMTFQERIPEYTLSTSSPAFLSQEKISTIMSGSEFGKEVRSMYWSGDRKHAIVQFSDLMAAYFELASSKTNLVPLHFEPNENAKSTLLDPSRIGSVGETCISVSSSAGVAIPRERYEFATKLDKFNVSIARSDTAQLLASLSEDGELNVWTQKSKTRLWSTHDKDCYEWISFSPDGQLLAITSRRGVKIWAARSGILVYDFKVTETSDTIWRHAFSQCGKVITVHATDSSYGVFVIPLDGSAPSNFKLPQSCSKRISPAVAVLSEKRTIVAIIDTEYPYVLLCDLLTGKCAELRADKFRFARGIISEDGRWLVTLMRRTNGSLSRKPKVCLRKWNVFQRLGITPE